MAFRDPSREGYLLLTFEQNAVSYRYTDWADQIALAAGTFTPVPSLQVTLPPNTGTLQPEPVKVEFPIGKVAFLDGLVDGSPQAAVMLHLREVTVSTGPISTAGCSLGQALNLGRYRLARGVRNADRRAGVGRLELLPLKARLNARLGIAATPRCAWTLGDKSCQAAVVEETATIAAISRKRITLTNPADAAVVTGKPAKYWHRGSARVAGLSLDIRDWVNDSYGIELVREPPASWLGATVTLRPGCDNTVATCNDRWANLENFGGFGIAIPARSVIGEAS